MCIRDRFQPAALFHPGKTPAIDFATALFSIIFSSVILSNLIYYLIELLEKFNFHIPSVDAAIPSPQTPLQIFVLFFTMALLPAICEEFVYRGILKGSLQTLSAKAAILFSSIAFGLMHGTAEQVPFAFCLGLVLGFFSIKTENFFLVVAAHFCNNFLSCLSLTVNNSRFDSVSNIAIIVIGLISLVIFFKRNGFRFKKEKETISFAEAAKAGSRSVFFWLFTAIYVSYTVITTLSL